MEKEEPKRVPRLKLKWPFLSSRSKDTLSTIGIVILAIVLFFTMSRYVVRSYQVDGQSMETTLSDNDRLIVNKIPRTLARVTGHPYIPSRGDIIIFNQSGLSFGGTKNKELIKRVIGLPGERVVIKSGKLTIYNSSYPGGYEPDKVGLYSLNTDTTPGNVDITLGNDEVFVCGDNRSNSEDSRFFGPVRTDKIIGKLVVRVWPINKTQTF